MSVLFRRHFWVVHLLVIGLCSGLIGRAASHAFEGAFLVGDGAPVVNVPFRRPLLSTATKPHGTGEVEEIVHRDVFCSGCVATLKGPDSPATAGPTSNDPVKTSLQIELVSTMISDDEAWSMAVIRDLSTKEKDAEMFNRGKKIFGTTAVVKQVLARRVYLEHEGRVEFLDLDATAPAPVAAAAVAAPAAPSEFGDLDKSIQCSGTNCTIERSLVEKALANTAALSTMARFIPSMRDGKPNGFKVYAIPRGSLFARLGLQTGDTLKQINGNEMATPDEALGLYTKLRTASHLSLQVERRGETVTMDYTIK